MSGVHGYPPYGGQRATVAVSRLVAAALLTVGAALAVGGSFGTFSSYRFESEATGTSTITSTGWWTIEEPASDVALAASILHGIPITVAAVVALLAALLLVVAARSPGDPAPGRLLGVGAAGLLVGVVAVIWLELVTRVRNVAVAVEEAGPDSSFRASLQIGAGGYLILVAGVAVLVAAALLLTPRRDVGPVPLPPGRFPPLGPDQAPWMGGPPPGPAPGWGPPPPSGWAPPG
jgi:hypothetical protein